MKSKPELLTAIALVSWLLPVAAKLPQSLTTALLSGSLGATVANVVMMPKALKRRAIEATERELEDEILAHQMLLQVEAKKRDISAVWASQNPIPAPIRLGSVPVQPQQPPQYQPVLEGGYLGQNTIAPSAVAPMAGNVSAETEDDRLFHLEFLLESNSHHALLCGDTGAGKTTIARWLLDQLAIKDVQVLDPDDDGKTWEPFPVTGAGDDWDRITWAYSDALEEFERRKPNDTSLTPKAYIFEELPDHILEVKDSAKVLGRLLRRGRKRKVFCLAITQARNPSEIGLSAPVQKCFSTFYLQAYAHHALKYLVPKDDRPALREGLARCKRPALVEFHGSWFYWDVPTISAGNVSAAPAVAPVAVANPAGNVSVPAPDTAALERALATGPSDLHWKAIEFCLSRGQWVSLRDIQRGLSLPTAEITKGLVGELVSLELGEMQHDPKYDRIIFRAFEPDFSED